MIDRAFLCFRKSDYCARASRCECSPLSARAKLALLELAHERDQYRIKAYLPGANCDASGRQEWRGQPSGDDPRKKLIDIIDRILGDTPEHIPMASDADFQSADGCSRGLSISHLQRLPPLSPAPPRHNYGTPNLRSTNSWHSAVYGLTGGK
jgi:hypothetical protein